MAAISLASPIATAVCRSARYSDPTGAAFLAAARALQKAVVAAKETKDEPKERALEAALTSLSAHAADAGLRMPQPRAKKPGGRRRKPTAA